jgi:hypothetical protein
MALRRKTARLASVFNCQNDSRHSLCGPEGVDQQADSRYGVSYLHLHLDLLGSSRALTNSSGATVPAGAYDNWGNAQQNPGTHQIGGLLTGAPCSAPPRDHRSPLRDQPRQSATPHKPPTQRKACCTSTPAAAPRHGVCQESWTVRAGSRRRPAAPGRTPATPARTVRTSKTDTRYDTAYFHLDLRSRPVGQCRTVFARVAHRRLPARRGTGTPPPRESRSLKAEPVAWPSAGWRRLAHRSRRSARTPRRRAGARSAPAPRAACSGTARVGHGPGSAV